MKSDDELTNLLHTASRAVGPEVQADPRALISRVRHRRQVVGLALAAAVALLGVATLPALLHRPERGIDVAAGGSAGGALADGPSADPLDSSVSSWVEPIPTTSVGSTTAPAAPSVPPPTTAPGPTAPSAAAPAPTRPTGPPATGTTGTTGTAPTTPTTKGPGAPPELVAASGNAAASRVILRFSRPVVPGDGAGFDRPSSPPTTQDTYMAAMQLVVHQTDSTCSNPQGNAHQYQAGVGTDTLTVEASSLVVGTTYISISPGFAKAADDGTAMKWVTCIPLTVKG